jgi:hypothetical protein
MTTQPVILASSSAALALLLAGCSQRDKSSASSADAKLRVALVGTWVREGNGMLALAPDGSFSSRWTNTHSNPVWIWAYDGTWAVTNGTCLTTLTKSQSWGTTNREREGSTEAWRMLRVGNDELVWECNGQTNKLLRAK